MAVLTSPDHDNVRHVVDHLRAADREELFALRDDEDPRRLVAEVMARPEMTWVAWWEKRPAVVLGAVEWRRGVWHVHCFGTDDFGRLALPLTRFVRKTMLPLLFDTFGAHRLTADSLGTHTNAHRWMELCGARREGVRQAHGKGGEDFATYVIVKDVDWPKPT